jgi:hypothetical protein
VKIEYQKTVKVDELAKLIPTKHGATFSQLWQVFHYTRMFKYVEHRHYPKIKGAFIKICTHKNLRKFCELGYFKSPGKDIYCATNKVLPILKEAGYNIELLPNEPVGVGDINEIHNTDAFVQAVKVPHFKTLLYPQFGYLIPDALMVQLNEDTKCYKLSFLEIEAKKPKWNDYVERKRDSYLGLSKSLDFYEYWKTIVPKLNLPIPLIENFKFNVIFVCSLNKNFGNGFKMVSQISDL